MPLWYIYRASKLIDLLPWAKRVLVPSSASVPISSKLPNLDNASAAGVKQSEKLSNLFKLNSIKAKPKQTTTVAIYRPLTHTRVNLTSASDRANFFTASEQKAIKAIFTSEFKTFPGEVGKEETNVLKPAFHMSGKPQTVWDFTVSWPSQILPTNENSKS